MTDLFPGFLTLSAALFALGALGVMVRRNPLVVFMSTMAGQVFALIVIAVAASEVVVGLALITLVYRSGRHLDLDELSEMSE